MPSDESIWFDNDEGSAPVKEPAQENHQEPGRIGGTVRLDLAFLKDRELLAEKQILGGQRTVRATKRRRQPGAVRKLAYPWHKGPGSHARSESKLLKRSPYRFIAHFRPSAPVWAARSLNLARAPFRPHGDDGTQTCTCWRIGAGVRSPPADLGRGGVANQGRHSLAPTSKCLQRTISLRRHRYDTHGGRHASGSTIAPGGPAIPHVVTKLKKLPMVSWVYRSPWQTCVRRRTAGLVESAGGR